MRVKCVICDTIQNIDDNLPLAKKLRNRPFTLTCVIIAIIVLKKIRLHV